MSVFKTIFGNSEEEKPDTKLNWKLLTQLNQLDELVLVSAEKPVLIFKHSTRCAVSRMVLKQLEREFDLNEEIECHFLDLLQHRDISNEIANRFSIQHQSPQMIVIKDGKAVYNASHESIDASTLNEFI